MKKALITGVTGQDGAYLADILLKKGYKVFGTFRRVSTPNFWRLQSLGVYSKIHLIPADLLDMGSLLDAVSVSDPDEVYNLGASSFVSSSFEQSVSNAEITGLAVTKFLESIRNYNSKIKFYQASSSEMYGNNGYSVQNEKTPFMPASPYAVSKLYDPLCQGQEIVGRRTFLLRAVLRVRLDINHLFGAARLLVHEVVALRDKLAELTDDFAEVLARGDHAPPADRV